ncbi:MucBP domain-containing protein, partial [Enterococcus cecorum]|uniref:MucBP domain-containing protein n=1 Tax=Enterococcus cecorum TaxID=44008 RepID=UPI001FAE1030
DYVNEYIDLNTDLLINSTVKNRIESHTGADDLNYDNYRNKYLSTPIKINKDDNKDDEIIENNKGQLTVNYLDEDGNQLLESKNYMYSFGDDYGVTAETIQGYKLIGEEFVTGIINQKETIVNFIYKKVDNPVEEKGKVIVNYLDENGNKIIDSKEFSDNVGNEFTVNAPSLDGYELISDEVMTGKVAKEDTIINFNYKKEKEVPVEPEKPVEPTEPEKPVEPTEPEKPVEAPEEPLYQTNANKPNKNLVIANLVVFTTAILGTAVSILKKGKKG